MDMDKIGKELIRDLDRSTIQQNEVLAELNEDYVKEILKNVGDSSEIRDHINNETLLVNKMADLIQETFIKTLAEIQESFLKKEAEKCKTEEDVKALLDRASDITMVLQSKIAIALIVKSGLSYKEYIKPLLEQADLYCKKLEEVR